MGNMFLEWSEIKKKVLTTGKRLHWLRQSQDLIFWSKSFHRAGAAHEKALKL